FTSDNTLLVWSASYYYLYDLQGKLQMRGAETVSCAEQCLIYVFYKSQECMRFITWSGSRDDWNLVLSGRQRNASEPVGYRPLKLFKFCASLAFLDDDYTRGYVCIENDGCGSTSPFSVPASDVVTNFSIVEFKIQDLELITITKIADNLEERANTIVVWNRPPTQHNGVGKRWIAAVFIEGFLLYEASEGKKLVNLRLPSGVRNIPIRPMHTTTAITLASEDTIFVAGVRKYLYLWNVSNAQLLRSVDAHFGRTLNLCALNLNGHNVLLSSSLDHSIKMWNMENIFEKSFSISMMDQPIEKIEIAKNKPSLAVVQTRKYLALWNIRLHKYIATLVANVHGAVITDCMISSEANQVVCIESETLLVWDLRTQSVLQRMNAPHVHQIVYLNREKMIGKEFIKRILFRQVDTPEQKVARFTVYSIDDLSIYYSHEFHCRMFRNIAIQRDGATIVFAILFRGHDSLQVVNLEEKKSIHRFRPRLMRKQQKDVIVYRLIPMPHNSAQLIVMESASKGAIWDIKARKLIRTLPSFSGVLTSDGRLGLHAPNRGGLHIIDMKTGGVIKTLIGNVVEGVNDVQVAFTPTGQHVLYYHNGHKTLRAFRVSDGTLVGTLRPHVQLKCWTCDSRGYALVIGGQDGSLLTVILFDEMAQGDLLKTVAQLPSRRHLADYLHIPLSELQEEGCFDLRNLRAVTAAVTRFKQLLQPKDAKRSHVCCVQ
uniref:WD_REPEATS_REGION domain-containing protein n=1 Tax=Parascaris univalens TaxID=6257 RepID=A0A915AEI7_PARUN